MAGIFSAIASNPFSSQVGQKIEQATDPNQSSEDWQRIVEICDMINETDEGPKDAVKAIRKRLSNHKYPKSILFTLTLTEACAKNCGPRFHKQIATKEFLMEMTKVLGQKGQPSTLPYAVKEKVLSLIQSWADAFRNAPELQQIQVCYQSLKDQGHEFPAQDLDTLSPMFTPNKSNRMSPPSTADISNNQTRSRTFAPTSNAPSRQQVQQPVGPINPTPEQLSKLRLELDIVEGNHRVLSEMLSELQPGEEQPDDYKLLVELNKTCREMQSRLVALLDKIANEEVTGVLLKINDNLNNVFIRYDRYERNRKVIMGDVQPETQEKSNSEPPARVATTAGTESSLISFDDNSATTTTTTTATTTTTQSNREDAEFDMFAQARSNTFADSRAFGSTYDDNTDGVPNEDSIAKVISDRGPYPPISEKMPRPSNQTQKNALDDDLEDVEEWLKNTDLAQLEADERAAREAAMNQQKSTPSVQTSDDVQTLSSTEFDKFLSERAKTGSTRVSTSGTNQTEQQTPPPRQMKNFISEKDSDDMFAL